MKKLLLFLFLTIRQIIFRCIAPSPCPPPKTPTSILLVRLDRLGDLTLSTAIFPRIRQHWPEAEITILVSKGLAPLLLGHPDVDRVIELPQNNWRTISHFAKKLKKEEYQLAIDLSLTRDAKAGILLYLSQCKFRVGFGAYGKSGLYHLFVTHPGFDKLHFVEVLDSLVDALDIPKIQISPKLVVLPHEREKYFPDIAEWKPYFLCHPGAYYPTQRYPLDKLVEVLRSISQKEELSVRVTGGPGDEELLCQLETQLSTDKVFFHRTKNLRELLVLTSSATLYFGNNSGPLHLAMALNIPTISTLGPTRSPYFLPYGEHGKVLTMNLTCAPCDRAVCDHHSCLQTISPTTVVDAIEAMQKTILSS